ncbi:unnamed protein product [Camellia sinensis]
MAGALITPAGDDSPKDYPGKLTWYVFVTCIIAAMGGLIFGYNIGISGGVTSMAPFLEKFFPSVYRKEELDQSTNQYCKFNSQTLTMFTSSLYLAALFASFLASTMTKKLGRNFSMLMGGCVFCCGALLNAFAIHLVCVPDSALDESGSGLRTRLDYPGTEIPATRSIVRAARPGLCVGVGFATQSVPLFVSEMAPHRYCGTLNVCFQLFITIGILIAGLVNYFTNMIKGDLGRRISLGSAAVPAVLMIFSSLWVSETPNSLIERGHLDKAKKQLQRIRGVANVQAEFNDLVDVSAASKEVEHPWRDLSMRKYRPQLCLAILIPMFQQLTGINVVMFYAPVLFKTIGFQSNTSLASAMITGGVNVLATFISVFGTDRWGRKPLFLWGGGMMIVAVAVLIGAKFGVTVDATDLGTLYSSILVCCICIFVTAFAFSWGPLGWLVPSEIFPQEIRSSAQSIVVAVNMSFTLLVAQLFLAALCMVKYGLFIIFAGLVLIMSLFVVI